MKKIFITLLCALGILGLAACGDDNGGKTPAKKKTVIQYCGWDLGSESNPSLKRRMIEEFNKNSEDIIIDMLPSADPLQDFLNTLASNGSLPDVFLIDSVPTAVVKEWALDITSLTATDPEWNDVDASLRDSITYNGSVFALPAAQNYIGFFANYDLIDDYAYIDGDAEEVFAPGAFTTDQMFQAVREIKNEDPNGASVIGINAVGDMINWMPSTIDKEGRFEHFVWDGEKFDFTGPVMIEALTKIQTLGKVANKYTFNSYFDPTAEEDPRIKLFGSAAPSDVFLAGQIGFYQGMTSDNVSKIKFDYKFVGYPDQRVISAGDYLCISKACKNPEAAYEVARYLAFSAEGINARYDIVEADSSIELAGLPVNNNPTVTAEWFNHISMKGVKEVYDKVVSGEMKLIIEGLKTIPGFKESRYTKETGIKFENVRGGAVLTIGDLIWDVCEGAIDIGQYTSQMTEEKAALLNKEVTDAMAKIKEIQSKK